MSASPSLLLLGASSDIGRAIAERYARDGWSVTLAGRSAGEVEREAADLRVKTRAEVGVRTFDVTQIDHFAAFADGLGVLPDMVVSVIGAMGDQTVSQADSLVAARILRTNFEGPALILELFANRMAVRGTGVVVGVSSVAGDRGRSSNYVYGSAKAGLTAYLSGLRQRLSNTGVRVVTVKPGFVHTAMTAGMKLSPVLTARPEEVAVALAAGVKSGTDVIYVRWMWRFVMLIICAIPERVFKKMTIG